MQICANPKSIFDCCSHFSIHQVSARSTMAHAGVHSLKEKQIKGLQRHQYSNSGHLGNSQGGGVGSATRKRQRLKGTRFCCASICVTFAGMWLTSCFFLLLCVIFHLFRFGVLGSQEMGVSLRSVGIFAEQNASLSDQFMSRVLFDKGPLRYIYRHQLDISFPIILLYQPIDFTSHYQ